MNDIVDKTTEWQRYDRGGARLGKQNGLGMIGGMILGKHNGQGMIRGMRLDKQNGKGMIKGWLFFNTNKMTMKM